ncbi:MAG: 16S rRNA (cytidine(1402)-2'-O)-methyltransferase [Chloroflexi bacterium]|nr:16S rRNA (cytidine(1402)-2'-O)-methyltransferase [Chloroflexota bacterium]|tara:strand:+ start:791 stop:1606 length:816 start_codon:yes stop_codon:yes gene_type:complete
MGTLFIVATPIGNLKDITFRAVEILNNVEIILSENTRISKVLLKKYNISTRLISYNDHNHKKKIIKILEILKTSDIALITDAGTPGISDPGSQLVLEARKNDITINAVPGPSALSSAISISGLKSNKFCFIGFPPKKYNQRKETFLEIIKVSPIIMFESPRRIINLIKSIDDIFEECNIILFKEITKIHESVFIGNPAEILKQMSNPKGEYVLILQNGKENHEPNPEVLSEEIKKYIKQGLSGKDIVKKMSISKELPKKMIYELYLKEKDY